MRALRGVVWVLSSSWLLLAIVVGLGSTRSLIAQPISFDEKDPEPVRIEFGPDAKLGDQVGRMEGVTDDQGRRFFLKGLDVMSPLIIQVFAKDETKPIDVSLHRYFWKTADLEGQTNEEGDWGFAGRVHDEVGIELRAGQPSEFYVLAWQGPAAEQKFGVTAFTPDPSADRRSGGGSKTVLFAALSAFLLAAVIAMGLRLRRRGALAGMFLGLALVSATPSVEAAEAFGARLARAEARIERFSHLLVGLKNDLISAQADNREIDEHQNRKIEELKTQIRALRRTTASEVARLEGAIGVVSGVMEGELGTIYSHITQLYLLVEEDRAAIPDPTHSGMAPMPSRCYDNPACADCFNEVNYRLGTRLAQYEILRVIYQTNKNYVERMRALGDAMSGWHQFEQAMWFRQKIRIMEAEAGLTQAYKAKFTEFNADLRSILQDFGQCEAQHGLDDWYNRYGSLYYNGLIASYRIP